MKIMEKNTNGLSNHRLTVTDDTASPSFLGINMFPGWEETAA
jgi:hypothetical protein